MEERVSGCLITLLALLLIALILLSLFDATPWGRLVMNTWRYAVEKADDATSYETRKNVEDTCRAMIASYNTDKATWDQYKGELSEEKRSWADQAMMRANQTASSYNEYILKNSFVWGGNVPTDIRTALPLLIP